jgi:hypothetical protein
MMRKLATVALLIAGLTLTAAETAQAPAGDEKAWRELFALTGGKLPEGKTMTELVGPLPGDSALAAAGCLPPRTWADRYQRAPEASQLVMRRGMMARLRDLARWDLVNPAVVEQLLGPEGPGVNGSEFFGMPPVPGAAYRALVNYLEYAAERVPGEGYQPSAADEARIGRALQASLALSSADGRLQYHNFDVVWSNVLKDQDCAGPRQAELLPGVLWLYVQLRASVGLDFLPTVSADLQAKIDADNGRRFTAAREEAAALPDSLAALTCWRCPAP